MEYDAKSNNLSTKSEGNVRFVSVELRQVFQGLGHLNYVA